MRYAAYDVAALPPLHSRLLLELELMAHLSIAGAHRASIPPPAPQAEAMAVDTAAAAIAGDTDVYRGLLEQVDHTPQPHDYTPHP